MAAALTPEEEKRRNVIMGDLQRKVLPGYTWPELRQVAEAAHQQFEEVSRRWAETPNDPKLTDLRKAVRDVSVYARRLTDWVGPSAVKAVGLDCSKTVKEALGLFSDDPEVQGTVNSLALAMATRTVLGGD
jgi:hypothetical protein